MAQRIISICFYLLLVFTPLFFTPLNNELFEYNKMALVYLLTIITVTAWMFKIVNSKQLVVSRTPLDIPILLFLLSQVLSTVFSIDSHTSIWGYYSRSNGGLLSISSYIILYYAFVSNFTSKDVFKFLKATLLGGLMVSLWAIPEHFGVSPSCILLTGQPTASCWVQDVQSRVFATLGQPNWLAAYLGMLIFPAFYFILTAQTRSQTIRYTLYAIIYYLAFTFTYSRGATLALLVGLTVFIGLYLSRKFELAKIGQIVGVLVVINLLFGSALTGDFRILKQSAPPARPGITQAVSPGTQLENGGTESGTIRLIVWKGALEIFKHYPILGSGVETFAYSYYNFRPKEHNLVSEWDFLYNKAHNEYLNYLATTGILGLGSYLLMVATFVVYCILYIVYRKKDSQHTTYQILFTSLLASYISYLVQNFFGFSVVMIALLFFLIPAFTFVTTQSTYPLSFKPFGLIYRRRVYQILFLTFVTFISVSLILNLVKYWRADTLYKTGNDYTDTGNPGQGYNLLSRAVGLNKYEPLYRSDLGFAAASAALALASQDASLSAQLKDEAVQQTELSVAISPKNTSIWRTAIRTYYQLSAMDPSFEDKTIQAIDSAITLAPTDPKLYYNKALILDQLQRYDEAVSVMKQAIELKPNYREAYLSLGDILKAQNKIDEAKKEYEAVLKLIPGDQDAVKRLEELGK